MNRWQAVIFDLDDTLYPEKDFVFSGFKAVSRWINQNLGLAEAQTFQELRAIFDSGLRGKIFNVWLSKHKYEQPDLVRQLVKVYRQHTPILSPFPTIPPLLGKLRHSFELGLVSDGYLAVQKRKLTALNLDHHFDAIVFSDQWGREYWKPNVRPFQAILDQLKVTPEKAVYIGDNPTKDFLGARKLGMFTIWYRWSGGEYAKLVPPTNAHEPDTVVESFEELQSVLVPHQDE